jgi:ketosteroid isomerase-like protein
MSMSAAENKAATKAAYQAFGVGDLEGAMQDLADDIEWIVPGDSTISGTYRGKDEVMRLFATLASRSFRTEPQHFIAEGDHVVVLTRTTTDGKSSDQADVLTFRGAKVARFESAGDTALLESIWGKK